MDYRQLVEEIAKLVHENFRRIYGGKPHIRTTKDELWIKEHNTDQIDLGAHGYSALPVDWRRERLIGSQIALDYILRAARSKQIMDDDFVEHLSEKLHIAWLKRNTNRATDVQKFQYLKLPDEEKEKDRVFVRIAMEVYKRHTTAPQQQ